jgi:hypothetical protein
VPARGEQGIRGVCLEPPCSKPRGVPAFSLRVEPGEYDIHHHAVTDTFDKVDPRLLAVDTAAMGVAAWSFADAPNPVGRRLSEAEADAVMKTSGVASTRRMLYGSSRR